MSETKEKKKTVQRKKKSAAVDKAVDSAQGLSGQMETGKKVEEKVMPAPVSNTNEKNMQVTTLFFRGDVATPAGDTASDMPKEIAGQVCTYLWKDLISVGVYIHPIQKFTLDVTPDRLMLWSDTGNKMIAAGVDVPINVDHSESAYDCVGYVKRFEVRGDRLYGLCQFIGEEAALLAARNYVSIGERMNAVDGEGYVWGDAIVHVALTPIPIVPDQDPFFEAARKDNRQIFTFSNYSKEESGKKEEKQNKEETNMADDSVADAPEMMSFKCSQETMDRLCDMVPGLKDAHDDEKIASVAQHLKTMSDMDDDDSQMGDDTASMSRAKVIEKARENRKTWRKNHIAPLPQDAQEALVEAFKTKLDVAFSRGAVDASTRNQLEKIFSADNTLAFSRSGGNRALALAVVDALAANKPVEVKEKSGLQVLSQRGDVKNPALEELNTYMLSTIGVKKSK